MKKLFLFLFICLSEICFAQRVISEFDTTAFDLSYLEANCIELYDEKIPVNANHSCYIQAIDSLFERDGKTWFLSHFKRWGTLGEIENWEVNEQSRDRQYGFEAVILFSRDSTSKKLSAEFVTVNDYDLPYQIKGIRFKIQNDIPLFSIYSNFGSQRAVNEYYMYEGDEWLEIESESWEDRINEFLPEGFFYHGLINVDIYKLTASSYIFDRQWLGPGDMMYDSEKLGKILVQLGIEDRKFVVVDICFTSEIDD